eukprot:5695219-Pleurochrysis_carterae.AAC.1
MHVIAQAPRRCRHDDVTKRLAQARQPLGVSMLHAGAYTGSSLWETPVLTSTVHHYGRGATSRCASA